MGVKEKDFKSADGLENWQSSIDLSTYRALSTIQGGEVVGEF